MQLRSQCFGVEILEFIVSEVIGRNLAAFLMKLAL